MSQQLQGWSSRSVSGFGSLEGRGIPNLHRCSVRWRIGQQIRPLDALRAWSSSAVLRVPPRPRGPRGGRMLRPEQGRWLCSPNSGRRSMTRVGLERGLTPLSRVLLAHVPLSFWTPDRSSAPSPESRGSAALPGLPGRGRQELLGLPAGARHPLHGPGDDHAVQAPERRGAPFRGWRRPDHLCRAC